MQLMSAASPVILLLPPGDLFLHEVHEPGRLNSLAQAIEAEGVLRHPPLAVRTDHGRYLLIDGAHRYQALQDLQCHRVPVQVVHKQQLTVTSWEHIAPKGAWWEELRSDPTFRWVPGSAPLALAEVVQANGSITSLLASAPVRDLEGRLSLWHKIVRAYSSEHRVRRLPLCSGAMPNAGSVLLRYPVWPLEEIEAAVEAQRVLPAGVTRFVVQNRVLNLSVPLSFLRDPSLAPDAWDEFVQTRIDSLRYYPDGVYLCEL